MRRRDAQPVCLIERVFHYLNLDLSSVDLTLILISFSVSPFCPISGAANFCSKLRPTRKRLHGGHSVAKPQKTCCPFKNNTFFCVSPIHNRHPRLSHEFKADTVWRPRLRRPNVARNHRKTRDTDCQHSESITMIALKTLMFRKSVSRLCHRLTKQNSTPDRKAHTKNCTA